jgi:hypothetical protein
MMFVHPDADSRFYIDQKPVLGCDGLRIGLDFLTVYCLYQEYQKLLSYPARCPFPA